MRLPCECAIHYLNLDDFLLAIEKRRWLKSNALRNLFKAVQFRGITPNKRGDWLNQAEEFADWNSWLPIASKEAKAEETQEVIFKLYSLGTNTSRDEWVYGHSKNVVATKVQHFMEFYQTEQKRLKQENRKEQNIEDFVRHNIKWTTELTSHLVKGTKLKYRADRIISGFYRPFVSMFLYYDRIIVHRTCQQTNIFPIDVKVENLAICTNGITSNKSFEAIAITKIPDLHFCGDTTTLPLWIYDKEGFRYDNITDWALQQFRKHYANAQIEKMDIFHYVYAILHDPRYRQKYALNLKTEFPRIPFHSDFFTWANIGEQLVKLHAYFEQVESYPLQRVDIKTGIMKVKLKADKINHRIEIDSHTTLMNIPEQAWQYQLGNRSALEWVLDQYKEKTPKDPTIREKFNTYRFADYKEQVIELLGKVCRVSVETMRLIELINTYEF